MGPGPTWGSWSMRSWGPAPRVRCAMRRRRRGLGPAAALGDRINALTWPVAAIDGPTGVDLETGASHGSAVRAAVSITFGGLRRGHLLARDEVGDVGGGEIGPPRP